MRRERVNTYRERATERERWGEGREREGI